jgi:3-isopropylmalate dehydrogenase
MAMMLNYSLGLSKEAQAVEDAINRVLTDNFATYDIMGEGSSKVTTSRMGDLIAERV